MQLFFAPMEGVTSYPFRRVHHRLFPGVDCYYSPFLAPDGQGQVKLSALRDVLPENNADLPLVPQILCNSADAFLALSRELAAMGYEEVDLNAGCPSGTVVPKHKGAGMLADLAALDRFLDAVFAACPLRVSVKTRLGLESAEEFPAILELYNRYPLARLTVHARDRRGMYKSQPDLVAFSLALSGSRAPVCYNGNIFTVEAYNIIMSTFPSLPAVMAGRGAVADPSLFRQLRGGEKLHLEEMEAWLSLLLEEHLASGLSEHFALGHMKEVLYYVNHMFPSGTRECKQVLKARHLDEYRAAVRALLRSGTFDPDASFPG